jgi:O-antigen/teichoic acid export membrane protein
VVRNRTERGFGSVVEDDRDGAGPNGYARDFQLQPGRLFHKLISWTPKGGLTLLDHAFITGSNFVISILLARWLSPGEYGAYAVAYAVLTLVIMLYQALLVEPMSIFGASTYRQRLRGYVKSLLLIHLFAALAILFSVGIAAEISLRLGQGNGLPGALLGVALGAPCILLLSLVRRTFYLELSPAPAMGGATLYCVLALGGLYLIYRWHWVSPMSALLLMGFGALIGSAVLLIRQNFRLPKGLAAPSLRETWSCHRHYGQWALAGAAMMWIPAYIFYPLLGSFSGVAQAGELKALMNFSAPLFQVQVGSSSLLLPYAARALDGKNWTAAALLMRRITWLCLAGGIVYWSLLLLFQGTAFRLLYSGKYAEVAYLLPVVALGSVSCAAFMGPATALRSMKHPDTVFSAVCISGCIAFAFGVPATWAFGIRGAVWAMALSETLAFAAAVVLLRRKVRCASVMASADS